MKDKKCFFEFSNNRITYTVVKTKRKTIGITVSWNGEVKVSAPFSISEKQIKEVLQEKADWVINKLNEARQMNKSIVHREFISGEHFLYLGEKYILSVVEGILNTPKVLMRDNNIKVYIPKGTSVEEQKQVIRVALIIWYRQCFSSIINEKIEKYSLQIGVSPNKVVIKDQKTRWGSCSAKGNVNLNWRLVMSPEDIIDYVVVHELCHLRVMNHSKSFWDLVKSVLPNYLESRKWLKVNGHTLMI